MSFKADIPTLSANEVYTLTFEYEGTETIQLIVGDLTLETTDRRVVFTTTSPVHYIESNVNLTNLNIYEGYYESDDFGGEYTQESYIEGKSEIVNGVLQCVKSPKIVSRKEDGTEESIITTPDDLELYELDGIFDKLDLTNGMVTKYIGNNNGSLYLLDAPTTEQLSLNPLKSYRNGSIQTSSQQLTPTLKTTLPISNKFTTTNLTSGSTYNVYFDGTATKLDVGGTIITNPVSPCEVECGGTTLTIEGTDIQNVRVIETTVKNEVGSVCGTTDVELSKIKTKCGIHNIFDDYFQGSHNSWAKDYNCTSTRDDTTVKIVGKSSLSYAGYSLVERLPFGTYKLHYKVKVSTIGDKYMVFLSSNPNGAPQDAYVPVTNVTSTALVEEQTFVFYKKHITNMLFYTYTNGQEIEYYDISLIKLSDEDVTGTDTSSINYSQTICDLEQPIKLRSLGTTYDSYNPVTGELIKRIGVSETDGSYSVLSSPIVSQVEIDNTPRIYKNGIIKIYSDSNIYPMMTLEVPTTNKYDTLTWETGVYTQRNIVEIYFNDSTTPMIPTETLTLTENHLLNGHMIIVGENPMLLKGNYTGRDIPYFEGMRSVEAIEIEVLALGSPDGTIFGKGGRK